MELEKLNNHMEITVNKFEKIYRDKINEEAINSHSNFIINFNQVVSGINEVIIKSFNKKSELNDKLKLYDEFYSFSYGFHFYDNDYLKYRFTEGFNAPDEVKKLKFNLNDIFNTLTKNNYINNIRYTLAQDLLSSFETIDQIKNLINKNYFNQHIKLGEYTKLISEKKVSINYDFSIKIIDSSDSNLSDNIKIEYYIITILESFFVSPQYLKDLYNDLSNYKTIMFSSPVYLSYQKPIGDIFFSFTYNKSKFKSLKLNINKIKNTFKDNDFLSFLYNELGSLCRISYFENLVRKQSTRIAIMSVMTRNLSHNIGSHVLSKLITIPQLIGISKEQDNWQCQTAVSEIKNTQVDPKCDPRCFTNYSFLAKLFVYLKVRMDYLADLTTNTPVIENTNSIYNDIFKPFIQNRILNDRISGLDTFIYNIYICNSKRCNEEECQKVSEDSKCLLKGDEDIFVSLPNDVLGIHSLYTILENIIRNTAKHGIQPPKDSSNKPTPVVFKIKVEEANVKFSDLSNVNTHINLGEYYVISIFDNCPNSKVSELVKSLNEKFNDPILQNNQLRYGAWGLIEMVASAAYLRKIPIDQIDDDQFKILDTSGVNPLTRGGEFAILQAYAEQNNFLGYRFFLHKTREILIIVNEKEYLWPSKLEKEKTELLLKKLQSTGVWIYSKDEFSSFFQGDKQKVFPHKLVVVIDTNNEIIKNIIEKNKTCFSLRFFYLNINTENIEFTKKLNCFSPDSDISVFNNAIDDFKLYLWEEYYKKEKFYSYKNEDLRVFLPLNEVAVTDSHGKNYCKYYNTDTIGFIEIKNSATSHFFNYYKENKKILTLNEIASRPIEIIIIDERIQDFLQNRYSIENLSDECTTQKCFHKEGGVPFQIIYQKTNIKVPQKEDCNLNAQSFKDTDPEKSKNNYQLIIEYIQKGIDDITQKDKNKNNHFFIVIHLGIIEKLISAHNDIYKENIDKDNKEHTRNFVRNVILTTKSDNGEIKDLTQYYNNIIITSGRGTPRNIPQDIRYLNFSIISQYLITLRNKFALTEALYSARKTN